MFKSYCKTALAVCLLAVPSIASAGYVAVVISDGCIVTAGRANDMASVMDKTFDHVEVLRPNEGEEKGLIAAALIAEFAQAVVKLGVSKGSEYVKSRAQDNTLEYDQVLATTLLSIDQGTKGEKTQAGTKWKFPVKLNPKLRCITIVTNVNPVIAKSSTYSTDQTLTWKNTWDEAGPQFESEVTKRLKAAGFEFANPNPSTVFEARLEFSSDGKGIRLNPLYFTAKNFESTKTKNARASNGTRSVGYTVTISMPRSGAAEKKLTSQNVVYQDVTVKNGVATIGAQSVSSAFGPKWAGAISSKQGWEAFSVGNISLSDGIELNLMDPSFNKYPLKIEPLNLRVKVSVTEDASDLYKFLAKFIEENNVESRLSDAIISDLGLLTDEQEKLKAIQKLNTKITELETFRDLYKLSGVDPESDEYKEKVKAYNVAIFDLKVLKAQLEYGCDATGALTSGECAIDDG